MPRAPGYINVLNHEKHCIKSDFKEMFFKLAANDRNDKMFLLTSKFHPQWVVSPCPGAIYMYKIMKKKCIKSDFIKTFLNLKQMTEMTRGFCLHQNFVIWGCLPLACGYIHLLNHEKMCIKSEVGQILFKLATKDHSDEAFLLTSKFWP